MEPLQLILELARSEDAGDPHAFRFARQDYLWRRGEGGYEQATFPWSESVLADLARLAEPQPAEAVVQRLGELLRAFLERLGWGALEQELEGALAQGREVHLTVRSAAAELFALPWELVTLRGSGQALGALEPCTVRYEWPGARQPVPRAAPATEGRILFAWSAAGGLVPHSTHLQALREACEQGEHPFDPSQDVLEHVSVEALAQALARAKRPITALHILCHGAPGPEQTYGLMWNTPQGPGSQEFVGGTRLRDVLAPYAGTLQMVVLCACHSGHVGSPDSHVGSVAQALHRVGIPAVVASRLPLSVKGSEELTAALYGELLGTPASLQRALAAARQRLRRTSAAYDWASLQLHARADAGSDLRPLILRPYRGLLAFEAKHRRFFFGRRDLEQQLASRVQEAVEGKRPRLQVVAGASGSGKSSLVLAGLVPQLPSAVWDVGVMRPSEARPEQEAPQPGGPPRSGTLRVLWKLLRGLRASKGQSASTGGTADEVLEQARGLRAEKPGSWALVVVDQFEELFSHVTTAEEREAFVRTLWRLSEDPALQTVVMATLRVDALERCGQVAVADGRWLDSVVYDSAHRLFVAPIRAEHLGEVITEPARLVGLELEPGLLATLKRDVEQAPEALPLLEHALDLLWQQREGRWLTAQAYEAMGGVPGAIARTADQLHDGLTPGEQEQARRLLVKLVDFRDETSPYTRRRMWLSQVRPEPEEAQQAFHAVLEKLVARRLVVKGVERESEGEAGETWLQVAHEALIRRWERLGTWLKQDRERELQVREVEEWAAAWSEHREDPDGGASYLLSGTRLGYARGVRERHGGSLMALARALIEHSEQAEAARRQEEQERQQKQLEDARALADARAKAARRLRAGLVVTGALLIAVVAGTVTVVRQSLKTEEQRGAAVQAARLLQAERLRDLDATLAALVLREVKNVEDARWIRLAHEVLMRPMNTVQFRGHRGFVAAAAFSADGQRVVTSSVDETAQVWRVDERGEPVVLRGHGDVVHIAAFSPDGQWVVTASQDGTARVWRADGRGEPVVLRGHGGGITSAAFSPDGKHVVTAFHDGTARVWRADGSGQPVVLPGNKKAVTAAEFSPDGRRVLTASWDGTVRVWRADGSGEPVVLQSGEEAVTAAEFSPDGQRVLTASRDGTVRVWRADGGGEPVVLKGHGGRITSAAFSPDGKHVVTASDDETARVWRADGLGKPVVLEGHEASVTAAAFSPDGQRVVTASEDETARVWSADRSGEPVVLKGHAARVAAAVFSPDGQHVVTASDVARVWRIDGEPVVLQRFGEEVVQAALNAEGLLAVTMSADWTLRLWRADGRGESVVLQAPEPNMTPVAISPDGQWLVTTSDDGVVQVWAVGRRGEPVVLQGHKAAVNSAAFSPDGQRVVTTSDDQTARVWRVDGSGKTVVLQGHGAAVDLAAFSPDGQYVVTGSRDGTAQVWRADGSGKAWVLKDPEKKLVATAAFSPDGKHVVTGSKDGTVRVWRVDGSREPVALQGHKARVAEAAFSPDGQRVVTASWDGTARVWRADGSGEALVLQGHKHVVSVAAFSADGRRVMTASFDGTVRLWAVHPDSLSELLRRATSICLTPEQRQRYLSEIQEEAQVGYERCEREHGREPMTPASSQPTPAPLPNAGR